MSNVVMTPKLTTEFPTMSVNVNKINKKNEMWSRRHLNALTKLDKQMSWVTRSEMGLFGPIKEIFEKNTRETGFNSFPYLFHDESG